MLELRFQLHYRFENKKNICFQQKSILILTGLVEKILVCKNGKMYKAHPTDKKKRIGLYPLSGNPIYIRSEGTSSDAGYRTFSTIYKYKFLNTKATSGIHGTGAGMMEYAKSSVPISTRPNHILISKKNLTRATNRRKYPD